MRNLDAIQLVLLSLLLMGTTFIIREGGVEVGRYEEEDGRDGIEFLDTDKPKPPNMVPETEIIYSDEGGYTAETVETGNMVPENTRTWTVSGRVMDVLRGKPVAGGSIELSGMKRMDIPVAWNGIFFAKIPALDNGGGYNIFYHPPDGYDKNFAILKKGKLETLSLPQRYALMSSRSWVETISTHKMDWILGAIPRNLTPEERKKCKDLGYGC